MESTGIKGRIQCSQSTADQLERSGKQHWIEPRKDLISAKGKGILQTYFVTPRTDRSDGSNGDSERDDDVLLADDTGYVTSELLRREREVEWVAEVLRDGIRDIVALRESRKSTKNGKTRRQLLPAAPLPSRKRAPADEFADVIKMPKYDPESDNTANVIVKLPPDVSHLVREYVSVVCDGNECRRMRFCRLKSSTFLSQLIFASSQIAAAYPKNPFHNFEHACHVLLCASKFLNRIVAPDVNDNDPGKPKESKKMSALDPVTCFAVLFVSFYLRVRV